MNEDDIKEKLKDNLKNSSEKVSKDNIKNENINLDLESKLIEEKDKFLRLYAEFDNYKKRNHKEKFDLIRYGNKEILSSLLPIIDDFDRAIKEIEKDNQNEFLSGIQLIKNKFLNILKEKGLKKMIIKIGDSFDSDKHEAITQLSVNDENLKGKIVDIIETGYLLYDKIIRFAKVVVGS